MNKVALGGGCHWCTEAIFQSLKGVGKVEQGWVQSNPPHDSFSEAVVVHYDSESISLETLIEIHLLTHSSTSNHPLREKYRSAIYYFDQLTQDQSIRILRKLKSQDQKSYITLVLPFVNVRLNEEQFLEYYKKQPEAPFCRTYINPKLRKLKDRYRKQMVDSD
jgi:peptide-methionine (S)-S-oxide reductase